MDYSTYRFSGLLADIKEMGEAPLQAERVLVLLDSCQENLNKAELVRSEIETELFSIEVELQEVIAGTKELTSDVKRKAALNNLKTSHPRLNDLKEKDLKVASDIQTIRFCIEQLKRYFTLLNSFYGGGS